MMVPSATNWWNDDVALAEIELTNWISVKRSIIPMLLILPTFYLYTGLFLYLLTAYIAVDCLRKDDDFTPIMFYFAALYLLPFGLMDVVLEHPAARFFDHVMIAAVPLSVTLPIYMNALFKNKKLKYIILLLLIPFLISTIYPGLLYLLYDEGYPVRFIWVFNYFQSILVGLASYHALSSSVRMLNFIYLLIVLGLIVAVFGLIQHFCKFYFFTNTYAYQDFSRLSIISQWDPVELFPFFIVSFSFSVNYLLSSIKKNKIICLSAAIVFLASIFTYSRTGISAMIFIVMSSILLRKKLLTVLLSMGAIILFYFIIGGDVLAKLLPEEQLFRLTSQSSYTGRLHLFMMSFNALLDNWFLGVGIGNSVATAFSYTGNFFLSDLVDANFNYSRMISLHNFFLYWILSMGVLIVPGILLCFYFTIRNSVFIYLHDTNIVRLICAKSIMISLFALSMHWFQSSSPNFYFLFLFLAMSFAVKNMILNCSPNKTK